MLDRTCFHLMLDRSGSAVLGTAALQDPESEATSRSPSQFLVRANMENVGRTSACWLVAATTQGCEDNETHRFEDYGTIQPDNSATQKVDIIHHHRSTCLSHSMY